MPEQDRRSEAFMRGLFDATIERAKGLAGYMDPGMGGKRLSDDEIDAAWNTRALTVEQEWNLWRQGRTPESVARGERMLSPEEIGMQVFPHREKLGKSGGRIMPKAYADWVNQRANREEKKRQTQAATSEGSMLDGGE